MTRPAPEGRRASALRARLAALLLAAACAALLLAPRAEAAQGLRLQKLPFAAATAPAARADASLRRVRVRVLQADGRPAAGVAVRFSVLSAPPGARGMELLPPDALSGGDGMAESHVRLGDRPGTYSVGAVLAAAPPTEAPVVFSLPVRDWRWWLVLVVGLVGGLAIFLYGMGLASEGMTNAFGRRMRTLLGSLTHNRVLAVAVGVFVTVVIQSSSATTVMLVGFVQARLMTFVQTLGVILGAHIGTTVTTQIIAFNVTEYSLLLVAAGFATRLVPGHE
jgi:phosphate:Na+ symporter